MYRTNHLIFTMGEDFNYENAATWYDNLDRLIKLMKKFSPKKINIFYSTPSCYLFALNQANITWPVKDDDFFPYSSASHSYWAGFYTSRPAIKYCEIFSNSIFQSIKQLHAIVSHNQPQDYYVVDNFYRAMGVLQHHLKSVKGHTSFLTDWYAVEKWRGQRSCLPPILRFLWNPSSRMPARVVLEPLSGGGWE